MKQTEYTAWLECSVYCLVA